MHMNINMKRISGMTLILLLLVPGAACAQALEEGAAIVELSAVESVAVMTPESDMILEETSSLTDEPSTNDAADAVQETANVQEMIEGVVLENTANPETESVDELEVIGVVTATSTAEVIEVVVDPEVDDVPAEEVIIEEPILDVVAESLPTDPMPEVVRVEEAPVAVIEMKADVDPAYVVSLSGKTIPTKKRGVIGTSDLTVQAHMDVDAATGVLTVSGTCASPYFVVLIFKNQTDYEMDPRSFIVNRAYPCVNGAYSYSIDRLPPTLQNGTYYLMIGEQGERGPWTPATGLTEIAINRSN